MIQQSDEWFEARLGDYVTASKISAVMSKGRSKNEPSTAR